MSIKYFIGQSVTGSVIFGYTEEQFKEWRIHATQEMFFLDFKNILVQQDEDIFIDDLIAVLKEDYDRDEDPVVVIGYPFESTIPTAVLTKLPVDKSNPFAPLDLDLARLIALESGLDDSKTFVYFDAAELCEIQHAIDIYKERK